MSDPARMTTTEVLTRLGIDLAMPEYHGVVHDLAAALTEHGATKVGDLPEEMQEAFWDRILEIKGDHSQN